MRFGADVLIFTLALAVAACSESGAPEGTAESSAEGSIGIRYLAAGEDEAVGEDEGFARATEPRSFEFPADHGSHPEYRTEWWYFTGNLHDADGRHYGFEVTFFRVALSPEPAARDSGWAANHVWMAHLAVTDTARGRFVAHERFARGALGLAGASVAPFRVWTEQWSVEGDASGPLPRFTLRAREGDTAIELELAALKPAVANGDRGLDAKGPEPGNASYYYSLTRLEVRGEIETEGRRAQVQGLAWMDREWSTSALSPGVVGWDWFALQLSDGRDLMFYRLRLADGSASPFTGGSLVERDGTRTALSVRDAELEPLRIWRSPRTGVRYPVAWRLAVPSANLDLTIEPRVDDQELDLTVRYWEGAVQATDRGGDITAVGYLELAGY